jgi:hypothetical protein
MNQYNIQQCPHWSRGADRIMEEEPPLGFDAAKARCKVLQDADPANQREYQTAWTMTLYFPKLIGEWKK